MKKSFIVMSILLVSIMTSACGSNSDTSSIEREVTSIHAEYPVFDTAEDIVDASNLVFSGTVTEISYETLNAKSETGADTLTGLLESSDIPYTIFEISVDQVYKGNVDGDTILIKRPGGKLDGETFVLDDASLIEQGETYLFITEGYENSYPSLLNVTQASYNINEPEKMNNEESNGITLAEVMEYLNTIN